MEGDMEYDPVKYNRLVESLYAQYTEIKLPPEYASFIENDMLRLLIRLARYKFVAKQLHPDDKVLEIGCGSGVGSVFLSQHCHSVKGIDLKSHEIEEAQSINRRSNVDFEVKDFFEFSEETKFNVIVSLDVIEHMPVTEGEKLISRTLRHLHNKGMLVIGTPSIYSYDYQGELSKAAHVKCYDLSELTGLISKYYARVLSFSMNDEIVHTGHPKMAWYYFILAFYPKID